LGLVLAQTKLVFDSIRSERLVASVASGSSSAAWISVRALSSSVMPIVPVDSST